MLEKVAVMITNHTEETTIKRALDLLVPTNVSPLTNIIVSASQETLEVGGLDAMVLQTQVPSSELP